MPQPLGVLPFTDGLEGIAPYSWAQRTFGICENFLKTVTFRVLVSLISISSITKFNQKMNKLLLMYGCVLLSSSAIAADQQPGMVQQSKPETKSTFENSFTALNLSADWNETTFDFSDGTNAWFYELNLDEIEFMEEEMDMDLGFNTSEYLPKGFNPYETYFDLNSIIYLESEVELDLGFDTQNYLPNGFDPYTEVVDVHGINFLEEEDMELGFNTWDYLPEGFSPYEIYVDLNAIAYIEDDVELELGLDTEYMLPEDFDPYTNVIEIASVNYMEDDEVELGFDTSKYLPENFDPYADQTR